mgnify:CR=1 FL=1
MRPHVVHNNTTFVFACSIDEVPAVGGCKVTLDDGTAVAVFRESEHFFAIAQQCPHQHYNVMHRCHVHNHLVSCPMHGWTFDIRSGSETKQRGRIKTFETLVVNNEVYVQHTLFATPRWMLDDSSEAG